MDLFTVLTLAGMLAFIGVTIYVANLEQAQGKPPTLSRILLYIILTMEALLALSAYFLATSPDYTGTQAELWVAIGLVAVGVIISYAVLASVSFRQMLQRLISSFNANSSVHIAAFVFMIALFLWNTIPFVMQGGIEGFARSMQDNGVSAGEPVLNAMLQITAAFLGIGLYIRRTLPQGLERLGLRIPTLQDIGVGAGMGFVLLLLASSFVAIWQAVAPDTIEQQSSASNQIAQSFASLPLAFLLATSAALGEEIFMRGALQPVFGLVGSSLFFTSLHTQYLITPGLLMIFIVSLVLGLLRKHLSTNAAIVAHFVFNFVPLSLLAMGNSS